MLFIDKDDTRRQEQVKRIGVLFAILCVLAGCGGEATPTPDVVATRVAVERAVAATLTAEAPTATSTPTATPQVGALDDKAALDGNLSTTILASPELAVEYARENWLGLALAGVIGILLGSALATTRARRRHRLTMQAQAEEADKKWQGEVRNLKKIHRAEMDSMRSRHQAQIAELEEAHRAQVHELTTAGWQAYEKKRWQTWFEMLRSTPWSERCPEVEIEVKFVFPLLQALGYRDPEIELRTPVAVQHGGTESMIQADLVARDETQKAMLVVEAKAPGFELGEGARRQAQSYAFQLGAPAYLLTNGRDLHIYHRGVLDDKCVFQCSIADLEDRWERVVEVAGRENVLALRSRLDGIK